MLRLVLCLVALLLGVSAAPVLAGQDAVPTAVVADPPRDAAFPAVNRQLLVPSHGGEMNALFLLAAGEGPHPTLLLLHGLPGNEQNLDLAQAARRAGWNVLTLHYRGSWGSPGAFSIAGAIDDAAAAIAFLHRPEVVREYRIDPARIVAGGHSMGALAASLAATRADAPSLAGLVLLDPWNAGPDGRELAAATPEQRRRAEAAGFDDLGHSLAGANSTSLADEIIAHREEWDLAAYVPRLAARPLLVVTAAEGGGPQLRPLVAALRAAGADRVTAGELPSDHSFADHRIALAAELVRWLERVR